jgi:type I restriction enzyme R subunit/putative DNA methylase
VGLPDGFAANYTSASPMNIAPRTKREYLSQLVEDKGRWFRPLTEAEKAKGFLGWHERGYLPHCDYPGLVQFVTFRLADSLPESRRSEWEHLLAIEDVRERRTKLEAYLDRGAGDCWLLDPRMAGLAETALLHFHRQSYELLAWCVMPNHVHVLVEVWQTPPGKLIQSWKRFVATRAWKLIRAERRTPIRRGRGSEADDVFWEREYWDTFMREETQEQTAVRYIENNAVKAKLCQTVEEWGFGSARFRGVDGVLKIGRSAEV